MRYTFELYVMTNEYRGLRSVQSLKDFLDDVRVKKLLKGPCRLKVTDILKNPRVMERENIVMTPTLILKNPDSSLRLVGESINRENLMYHLGLGPRPAAGSAPIVYRPFTERGEEVPRRIRSIHRRDYHRKKRRH